MQVKELAKAGLTGWRRTAAEKVATPVANRTRFSRDQIVAALGAISLLLFAMRLFKTARRASEDNAE